MGLFPMSWDIGTYPRDDDRGAIQEEEYLLAKAVSFPSIGR